MALYPRTAKVLRDLDVDPNRVLADGCNETGYLIFGRHPDGHVIPQASALSPEISRVPWPSADAWARVCDALAADGIAEFFPDHAPNRAAADAVEGAAAWLEAQRDQTWNGNTRRPSNYARAANDLRRYAARLRDKDTSE